MLRFGKREPLLAKRSQRRAKPLQRAFYGLSWLLGILFFPLTASLAGGSTWNWRGPTHKNIDALAVSPIDSLKQWAGSFGSGVYKSTDGGINWVNFRTGMINTYVRSLLALNDTLLFAGTNDGVFRSTNGGTSWDSVLATPHSVRSLTYDSHTGALYAATYGTGLFKSLNLGQSWTNLLVKDITTNDSLLHQRAVAVFGRDSLYVGGSIKDIPTGGSLFRSIDGGLSWTQVQPGLAIRSSTMAIAISPLNPASDLIIGTAAKGVHESTNGGVNWQTVDGTGTPNPLPDTETVTVEFASGYQYCSLIKTGLVYLRSLANTALGWLPAVGLPGAKNGVNAILLFGHNQAKLLSGTEGEGTFASNDSGKTWSPLNAGLLGVAASQLLFSQNKTLVLGTDLGDQIWRSADSAATWTLADSLDDFNSVRGLGQARTPGAPIFAALFAVGFYKSSDDGRHWRLTDTVSLGNHFVRAMAAAPNDSQLVYAGTGNGVYKTVNGGASWQAANSGIPFSTSIRSLALEPGNSNLILAGTDLDYLYRTTDGGNSWAHVTDANGFASGLPFIRCLTFDPFTSGLVYAGGDSGRIFKSTDAGATWATLTVLPSPFSVRSLLVDPRDRSIFFAATFGSGIFISTDTAKTWSAFNTGLTDLEVYTLASDTAVPLGLYAGTGSSGVFKVKFSSVSTKGDLNSDGALTATDVVLMLTCVFAPTPLTNCPLSIADLNCSGGLSAADVVLELNLVFLGAGLPC